MALVICPRCKIEIEDWDLNKINLCINNVWYERKVCPFCFNKLHYMRRKAEMQVYKEFWENVANE